MEIINWQSIVESLLFAVGDEGLSVKQIAQVLEIEQPYVEDIIVSCMEEYNQNPARGIMLVQFGDKYQFVTKKENAPYLKKLAEGPIHSSLSQASLETLAIIAYNQPITRMEIEEIRGVKSERPIQTLLSKALIKEVGRAEGTGRAILYGTTKEFLDYFGLKSIDELPKLPEKLEDEYVQEEADLFVEKFQEVIDS